MRPKQVGAYFEELTETGEPYLLWACDIWECPECQLEICHGYGQSAIARASAGVDYERMKDNLKRIRLVSAR